MTPAEDKRTRLLEAALQAVLAGMIVGAVAFAGFDRVDSDLKTLAKAREVQIERLRAEVRALVATR